MRTAALVMAAALLTPAAVKPDPSVLGIGYICTAERVAGGAGPRKLAMEPGVGNSQLKIAANPQAQAWFDYGLQLADGFYHEDAKAAFHRAVELDPDCTMCLWGEAWSRGATLNFPVSAGENAEALKLVVKAEALAKDASPRDRALIAAMKLRYTPARDGFDPDAAFGKAMQAVVRQYPGEAELEVIAAQGLMMNTRRGDRSGIEPAIHLLSAVLARQPDHVGAIHFYIHATEFAGRAEVALPYAERLATLAPAASHLVHMPAHTLIHLGRYEDAALMNAEALGVEARYRTALDAPGPLGSAAYYSHNLQFGVAGALMAGDGPLALKFAEHAQRAYPQSLTPNQREGGLARTYIALARFAPERVKDIPEPTAGQPVLQVLRLYARGEAAAARGDIAGVRRELKAIGELPAADGPARINAQSLSTMAKYVLEGRAAMLGGDYAGAVRAYGLGADYQDRTLTGWDPPLWWYPVRRSLAEALLQAGQPADAAAEAERSLKTWPADGLALRVLAESQRRLGRAAEAKAALGQAQRSYRGDAGRVPAALI
jgi:tetratricopeptide (TPR) repeat protein